MTSLESASILSIPEALSVIFESRMRITDQAVPQIGKAICWGFLILFKYRISIPSRSSFTTFDSCGFSASCCGLDHFLST